MSKCGFGVWLSPIPQEQNRWQLAQIQAGNTRYFIGPIETSITKIFASFQVAPNTVELKQVPDEEIGETQMLY